MPDLTIELKASIKFLCSNLILLFGSLSQHPKKKDRLFLFRAKRLSTGAHFYLTISNKIVQTRLPGPRSYWQGMRDRTARSKLGNSWKFGDEAWGGQ